MDMISRIGLLASVILCVGAGYLFFIPQDIASTADVPSSSDASSSEGVVREIEIPQAHDESLNGSMNELADKNHIFIFNARGRSYEERYGTQHIGEGAFKTFQGAAVPHQLKPLNLPLEEEKKYLLLEGISENRVYQIVAETDSQVDLQSLDGTPIRLVRKER